MFRRGMTSLAIAGSVLLAVGVPTTMAGAATITKNDTYSIFAQLDAGISVDATIGTEGGVAVSNLAVFTFIIADVTCADGNPGQTLTALRAFSSSAVIKIAKDLTSGTASGTVSGQEEHYNECTRADEFVDVTIDVTMDFRSTSGITTSKSHTVTKFPDRSKDVFDDRFDSRDAAGTFVLGGTSYAPEFNSIVHEVSTDVFTPAPPHH